MHMEQHVIVGVHITNRVKKADSVQKVFTTFGCEIRTRLGLHDASEEFCSPNGLILLEMIHKKSADKLVKALSKIKGVETQTMVFDHP